MNANEIVTDEVTVIFEHINQPQLFPGRRPRYTACFGINKSDTKTTERIDKAVEAAYHLGEITLKEPGQPLPPLQELRPTLRDGDLEHPSDPLFAGRYFLNAGNALKPRVLDENLKDIQDPALIHSGIIGRAHLEFKAYRMEGSEKGISCRLLNFQKLRDASTSSSGNAQNTRPVASAEEAFGTSTDADELLS